MKACADHPGLWAELRTLLRHGRHVWQLISRRHKLFLGSAALLMAVTSAGNTAVALLLGYLVDHIKVGLEQQWTRADLYWAAGKVLGSLTLIYVGREVIHIIRRALVENSCTRINRDMQVQLVGHLLKTDLGALNGEKVGALHGKIFRSVDGLVRFLRLMFLDCLPAAFTGLFALTAATTKQPILGLVMIGVIPFAVWLTVRQLMSQKGIRLRLMRDCEEIDGAVVEQLGGMEYVRVANTHAQEIGRLARVTEKRRQREVRHHFQMSLFGCAKALNEGLFHIIVLSLATYFAINHTISFGDVLTFSVLYLNVMAPLSEIHRILDEGHEASLRVDDLLVMLNEPVDRSFQTTAGTPPRLAAGQAALHIEDLLVEYRTSEGKLRRGLGGISLAIKHGETVGVAGRSGCGKSTWIKVLLRLLHPGAGKVLLGGVPLDQVTREDVARLFGYVGQNPFVVSGTIAENIAYGNGKVTPEQIRQAAELAHLHDEIMAMPRGYEAEVTERGQNLSGGQRQRLALARILLKGAPILILDEATSALDNISERHVHRSLGITHADRTTILIAHRLSTLRDCDRIFVFSDGQIAEVGTYDQLLEQDGIFAELVRSAEGVDRDDSQQATEAASAEQHALAVR